MTPTTITAGAASLYACVLALGLVSACSGGPGRGETSRALVPITEINQVVGEWEGTVMKNHSAIPEGAVRLMVRENGSYLFVGESRVKIAVGAGFLEPRDGRLIGDSDRRTVRLSLYDHQGISILLVEATDHETGDRYHGEFSKVP